MAEASCSGGTPFKRLVDQQSRDVSHHQDRLLNHNGRDRGSFRSSPLQPSQSPQDGFGAFMGGGSSLLDFHNDPATRLAAHATSLQPAQRTLASAHPSFSSSAQVTPVPNVNNWAADFGRFSSQRPMQTTRNIGAPSRQMNQSPAQLNLQAAFTQPNLAFVAPMFATASGTFAEREVVKVPETATDFDQEMSRWMSVHGRGNMEDVDAAMDEMARELEQKEVAVLSTDNATILGQERPKNDDTRITDLETPEIGSLSLESREPQLIPIARQEQVEADGQGGKSAVAEAAEKLLDCVKHEGGEKWQNSVFLSLMRDFRDGRKDIVGDAILPTNTETTPAQPLTT